MTKRDTLHNNKTRIGILKQYLTCGFFPQGGFTSSDQVKVKVKETKSHYDWRSVSQYVLVSSPILDFWPVIFFLQSFCLVFWGRPFWREVGSDVCQSLSLKSTRVSHYLQKYLHLN
jgi:hypothetical protein